MKARKGQQVGGPAASHHGFVLDGEGIDLSQENGAQQPAGVKGRQSILDKRIDPAPLLQDPGLPAQMLRTGEEDNL